MLASECAPKNPNVTAATVVITVACAVLAGYALVHLRPRGAPFIVALLIASLYFPTRVVSIITIYGIQDFLGLINSTTGLILPYITLNLAVSILIMRAVFQLVPKELMDAAHIDGAGVWRTLWMVGLPLVRTSVAHGTAYDIAGQGLADPQSLIDAARVAALLCANPERKEARAPQGP